MINLKNIDFSRGNKQIFVNYNVCFNSPGLNLITGKNGVGKTTLIKLIAGFIQPNKGLIVNKIHPNSHEWFQNHIYIGSNNSLSCELSIIENIRVWLAVRGWQFSENEIVLNLKKIGIYLYKDFLISQCSDGIKKKTDLCKLFFSSQNGIKFWLLDEPTNNLDDEGKKTLVYIAKKFLNNNGTIIMSSHEKNIFKIKYKLIKLI